MVYLKVTNMASKMPGLHVDKEYFMPQMLSETANQNSLNSH